MSSSVFLAKRTPDFTQKHDNNFSPINSAESEVVKNEHYATASVFGFMERKAIYVEGLGSILVNDNYDPTKKMAIPSRIQPSLDTILYPYGNKMPKDTLFSELDYNKIASVMQQHQQPENKTRALLVIYKNRIVGEWYADAFDKESKFLGWSMTKSITGTLFGILEAQNKVNLEAATLIESWKQDERKNITIRNLLDMNSGLEWDEDYETMSDVAKMLFMDSDMTKRQAEKSLVGKPNETWNYSSGTTNLLSGILRQQFDTHQEYLDFWYRELIDKIGMYSMTVETDMSGNYVGSSYGWATARDWAKFGLLYLYQGEWNGEQLFGKKWIDYVQKPTNTSKGQYSGQVWLNAGGIFPESPRNMLYFSGYQGQKVMVLPTQKMVVVRFGLNEQVDFDGLVSGLASAVK